MKIGEIIKIKNSIGVLRIKLMEELSILAMEFDGNMRLELHKRNDTLLITLTARNEHKKIVVIKYNTLDNEDTQAFLGEIQGTEEELDYFETVYE